MTFKIFLTALTAIILTFGIMQDAQAQSSKKRPSRESVTHAKLVSKACIGNWESQKCLSAVSDSSLVMVSNYGAKLKRSRKDTELETLKDHCAASTAAGNGDYPAYAMKSAYIECANIISDIYDATKVQVDQSHYQLLIGAVLCLSEDYRCKGIEGGLQKYTTR